MYGCLESDARLKCFKKFWKCAMVFFNDPCWLPQKTMSYFTAAIRSYWNNSNGLELNSIECLIMCDTLMCRLCCNNVWIVFTLHFLKAWSCSIVIFRPYRPYRFVNGKKRQKKEKKSSATTIKPIQICWLSDST